MSEELRPCPFCGLKFAEDEWSEFGEEYWVCDHCGASNGTIDPKCSWNTRPLEDVLNKRIAELKDFINQLIEAGENDDERWYALIRDWKEG